MSTSMFTSAASNTRRSLDLNHPREEKSLDRPDWLPEDWEFIPKVRTSGQFIGKVDKFYVEPTGLKFRSKVEALHYIKTGTKRPKRKSAPKGQAGSSGSTSNWKKRKTSGSALSSDGNVVPTAWM